jgi:hypothetical protein
MSYSVKEKHNGRFYILKRLSGVGIHGDDPIFPRIWREQEDFGPLESFADRREADERASVLNVQQALFEAAAANSAICGAADHAAAARRLGKIGLPRELLGRF